MKKFLVASLLAICTVNAFAEDPGLFRTHRNIGYEYNDDHENGHRIIGLRESNFVLDKDIVLAAADRFALIKEEKDCLAKRIEDHINAWKSDGGAVYKLNLVDLGWDLDFCDGYRDGGGGSFFDIGLSRRTMNFLRYVAQEHNAVMYTEGQNSDILTNIKATAWKDLVERCDDAIAKRYAKIRIYDRTFCSPKRNSCDTDDYTALRSALEVYDTTPETMVTYFYEAWDGWRNGWTDVKTRRDAKRVVGDDIKIRYRDNDNKWYNCNISVEYLMGSVLDQVNHYGEYNIIHPYVKSIEVSER